MKFRVAAALLVLTTGIAVAYQANVARQASASTSMSVFVPQGALLTIESPDFATLLARWSNSAQYKAWLASDDDAVFKNSRLFSRLTDAQASFATAAGIPADTDLLKQVAGTQSVFAWYDIGKLQFLYITRMPADQASRTRLLQSRASFERRHAGNADFYIRTSDSDYGTVAFAQVSTPSGDLLLLSTREDLMANALALIAGGDPANAVAQQPWFRDASAALPMEHPTPALHMVLNLEQISVDPHFRSYWVQRNISWTHQFRAASSNLYLEATCFREERVLLPSSSFSLQSDSADVTHLAALAPASSGVFRAIATQDPSEAVTAIQENLLGDSSSSANDAKDAPNPGLEPSQAGSSDDLETRIDTLPSVGLTSSTEQLTQLLRSARLDSVLSLSSAVVPEEQDGLWIRIHSAVVVHTAGPLDPPAVATALQQTLRGSLTASTLGIEFRSVTLAGATVYALSGPRPVFFTVSSTRAYGDLILLADDQAVLAQLLQNLAVNPPANSATASSIAVFDHSGQRAPYLRLVSLIDGPHQGQAAGAGSAGPDPGSASTPAFFSGNIGSLSTAFAALASERIVERVADSNLHQTVTYTWKKP